MAGTVQGLRPIGNLSLIGRETPELLRDGAWPRGEMRHHRGCSPRLHVLSRETCQSKTISAGVVPVDTGTSRTPSIHAVAYNAA
eukprot:scaffold639_cov215-Prasinococcus_capsulatus_cf.AAC.2